MTNVRLISLDSLGNDFNHRGAFFSCLCEPIRCDVVAFTVVQNNLFGSHEFGAGLWDFTCDIRWNRRNPIQVAVQQVTWMDSNPPHGDGYINCWDMAVPV